MTLDFPDRFEEECALHSTIDEFRDIGCLASFVEHQLQVANGLIWEFDLHKSHCTGPVLVVQFSSENNGFSSTLKARPFIRENGV